MLVRKEAGKQPVYSNEHTEEIITSGVAVTGDGSFNGFILSTGGKKMKLSFLLL